ncbi:MAG: TrmB family transcriptional regulator [Planctomycetes bacterium]|nr:TrmB family transcriptional regulator [Planctomycetota bacterium]MCA8935153.1 TrmB family transcriptional regulator [Planctomycetota bacterium]MCA8944720.1 TrmB family transcriptional regulator [Planctomycetota bacterium]
MNRDEWIQKLKKMGLSGYEAQVYLALLGETRAPASRVVRKSGVPQSKVYGALSSLVERGFAEQVLGDVKLYRGIPPEQAFENYRRSVEDALAESKTDMKELAVKAPDSPTDDPGSLGIRLVRSGQIVGVVNEAFDTVEEELLIAVKAPMVMGPDTEIDRQMLSRGVKLRYVIDSLVLEDAVYGPQVLQNAEDLEGRVRFADGVPLRMMVIDGKSAMIELAEEDNATMGLVVPNKGLAENMRVLFDGLWARAKTVEQLPERFRQPLTSQG